MKTKLTAPLVLLAAALTGPGCAHFAKTSTTRHELVKYGAAVPPQWQVVAPIGSQDLPGAATNGYLTLASPAGTNAAASGLFAPKPRIFVAYRETWTDRSRGGGTFVFTDPSASQVASSVTNQAALGGAHSFTVGAVSSTITTNAVGAIGAGGTALGNVVKAVSGK